MDSLSLLTETRTEMTPSVDTFYLTPDDRRTVFYAPSVLNGTWNIILDVSSCQIGDQMVIVFERAEGQELTIILPEIMLLTACGTLTPSLTLNGDDANPQALDFYYDGSYFLNTLDLG